jgi:hypothetical protein
MATRWPNERKLLACAPAPQMLPTPDELQLKLFYRDVLHFLSIMVLHDTLAMTTCFDACLLDPDVH